MNKLSYGLSFAIYTIEFAGAEVLKGRDCKRQRVQNRKFNLKNRTGGFSYVTINFQRFLQG